jgi:hypothetical protein
MAVLAIKGGEKINPQGHVRHPYIAAFKKIWENMDEVLSFDLDMNDPAINSL